LICSLNGDVGRLVIKVLRSSDDNLTKRHVNREQSNDDKDRPVRELRRCRDGHAIDVDRRLRLARDPWYGSSQLCGLTGHAPKTAEQALSRT
jgi:hypothetical protein